MKRKIFCVILTLALGVALAAPAMASQPVLTQIPADADGQYIYHEDIGWIQFYDMATDEISYIIPSTGAVIGHIAGIQNGYALVGDHGPYGLMTGNGTQIVPALYDGFSAEGGSFLKNGLILAEKQAENYDTAYTLYKSDGMVLAEAAPYIAELTSDLAAVYAADSAWIVNGAGAKVGSDYDDVSLSFSDGLCRVTSGGRDMYIDSAGKVVLTPADAQDCGDFHDGLASASRGGKYGYIDKTGAFAIQPVYTSVSDFSHGLARATRADGLVSLIDTKGTALYTGDFAELTPLTGTLVKAVNRAGQCGVYSTAAAALVVPVSFSDVKIAADGILAVEAQDPATLAAKYGLYNYSGVRLTAAEYDAVLELAPGLVEVTRFGALDEIYSGVFNASGPVIQVTEGLSMYETDGVIVAYSMLSDSGCGAFDLRGNVILPMSYSSVTSLGSVLVCDAGGTAALYDLQGRKLSADYGSIRSFSNGLACVSVGDKYGYIDRTGKLVIPASYTEASNFSDGCAAVSTADGKWGVIDTKGTFTQFAGSYTFVEGFLGGVAVASNGDGYFGLLDTAGNTVLDFKYANIVCADTCGRWFVLTDPSGAKWVYENGKVRDLTFTDLDQAWMKTPVEYVYSHGRLMQGINAGATAFNPHGTVDLGTTLTVIARILGQDTTPLPGENWYDAGWSWGARYGLTAGKTPTSTVTRQELVYMLWVARRGEGNLPENAALFDDYGQVAEGYRNAVNWAVSERILQGSGGNRLNPNGTLTRAELAAFIQRTCQAGIE